jgi:methionyl-tRNA synthetase
MARSFYITTPIYYVNDVPHLGTAYTTIAADALRRYYDLRGVETRLLTGTDEHGLKLERIARERGVEPRAFVDAMSAPFRSAWPELQVTPDDFIRTTERRHREFVHQLWSKIEARGYLEEGTYEDWYCVGCESFKTEKELLPGNVCAVHQKPAERLKEDTFFFKLSQFEKPLLEFYESHPDFIQPESRRNEVLSFVRAGLRDLSVSRTSFSWGIPVPGHERHIMYVWFDALSNYLSALQGSDAGGPLMRFWPSADGGADGTKARAVHLVGKDILRFHAVYWPAFLFAAGYTAAELPSEIYAHGFLTIDGEKMSKSLRNAVDPRRLAARLGSDTLRYHLLRAVVFGQDGDFDHAALLERYNADLGKNLGNLLSRTLGLCTKNTASRVPAMGERSPLELDLEAKVAAGVQAAAAAWERLEPSAALDATFAISSAANTYIDRAAPWTVAKSGDAARMGTILRTLLELLSTLSVMLFPAIPAKSLAMRKQLGLAPLPLLTGRDVWPPASLHAGSHLETGALLPPSEPLFPTYDKDAIAELLAELVPPKVDESATPTATPTVAPATQLASASSVSGEAITEGPIAPAINYDHFSTVDLRVGVVLTAERVAKKDKLLKLLVDLGEPSPRTIVAGLALSFTPEVLVGRRVAVVANLEPRDFGKGLVSHGMLLASGPSDNLRLASIDQDVSAGARLK